MKITTASNPSFIDQLLAALEKLDGPEVQFKSSPPGWGNSQNQPSYSEMALIREGSLLTVGITVEFYTGFGGPSALAPSCVSVDFYQVFKNDQMAEGVGRYQIPKSLHCERFFERNTTDNDVSDFIDQFAKSLHAFFLNGRPADIPEFDEWENPNPRRLRHQRAPGFGYGRMGGPPLAFTGQHTSARFTPAGAPEREGDGEPIAD